MFDSRFIEFRLDHTKTKHLAIGAIVSYEDIPAGGHLWRVNCYPRGCKEEDRGEHLSIYLQLVSDSNNVLAIFDAFAMGADGTPSWCDGHRRAHRTSTRRYLESLYLAADGLVTLVCGVIVVRDGDDPPPPPPSDVGDHLGRLLDRADGSDVAFVVGGEAFPAHRLAQLLGSMAEATMPSITLHDIDPETFRIMLRFIYADALPGDDEIGDALIETMRHLLAAADLYALDRLKAICAHKLYHNVSADTVAATLACAETYNCQHLKKKCIAFLADEKNLEAAMVTDGFVQLVQQYPSTVATFRPMLQAMYPEAFAGGDDEVGDSPTEIFERLRAPRYYGTM
ncbi:hypothetical protein PAHAL_6G259600 [Panicum hallii]|uniref:BTB domain-containing protein n=1 Tax=Panicum hallii TaxID=206008 RepID=A0A2T8IHM6_9POAL|nr:hypothetical protein PAHAL_6G259600 [Panicum hallii]